jgi:hypothetical protein
MAAARFDASEAALAKALQALEPLPAMVAPDTVPEHPAAGGLEGATLSFGGRRASNLHVGPLVGASSGRLLARGGLTAADRQMDVDV